MGPFARGSTGAQCVPASVQLNGSAVPLYNGSTYYDCLLWAAAWMYRATGDGGYLDDVSTFYVAHLYDETGSEARTLPQPYPTPSRSYCRLSIQGGRHASGGSAGCAPACHRIAMRAGKA